MLYAPATVLIMGRKGRTKFKWLGWFMLSAALLCPYARALNDGCPTIIAGETEIELPAGSGTEASDWSPIQKKFYWNGLLPVLMEGRRHDFVDIHFHSDSDNISMTTDNALYVYSFTDKFEEAYPQVGMPDVHVNEDQIVVHIKFYWPKNSFGDPNFSMRRVQGLIRSGFRADPLVHPQLRPSLTWNGGKSILTAPQNLAVDALIEMEKNEGYNRALVMPPGSGKTVTSAHYIKRLHETLKRRKGWKKKPKVLFVVEDKDILDEATETYEQELDLKKVAKIYGPRSRAKINPDVEMIAITRSSYFSRRDEIHKLLKQDKDQPWVIAFDEGHEFLKVRSRVRQEAQFHTIRQDLDSATDHRHRKLLITATLWHRDRALIRDYLNGNIYGGFLTDDEQALLRRGDIVDLQALCRQAFFAAVSDGYSPPLRDFHIVRNLNGRSMSEILDYSEIMKQVQQRRVRINLDLLEDVAKRIKKVRIKNVPDRGILYVPSIQHADAYERVLRDKLGEDVRVYHTGEHTRPGTYDWFNDRGGHNTEADKKKHKYIIVVGMLSQGANTQKANLVCFLRPYGHSPSGFRALLQNGGRAGRPFERKPYFRFLDWTGFSRVLVEGIASIIVEPYNPAHDGPRGVAYITVDDEDLTPAQFRGKYYDIFGEKLPFTREFPSFDLKKFQSGALRHLHEQAYHYGITDFGNGEGAQKLIVLLAKKLLERFPCPELEDLVYQFEHEWGWATGDGTAAKGAKTDNQKSVQRIYRALFEMAAIMKGWPQGDTLDLSKLHEEEGLIQLLDLCDPDRVRSLWTLEDKLLFIDRENGAWGALNDESYARGFGPLSQEHVTGKLMLALVDDIPNDRFDEEKKALLARVQNPKDLGIKKSDGGLSTVAQYRRQLNGDQNRARNRESFQRPYRVLYAIAKIMAKHPDADFDPEKIHEREHTERLLKLLRPTRVTTTLTERTQKLFADREKGAVAILMERSKSFGVPEGFARKAPTILLKILGAMEIPKDRKDLIAERDELIRDLKDKNKWGWVTKTGQNILNGYPTSTRSYFRALGRIATLFNKIDPDVQIRLDRLHLATEMERMLDLIQLGMEIPFFTERIRSSMEDETNGALAVLAERAKNDFGVNAYNTKHGPKRLAIVLVGIAIEQSEEEWPEAEQFLRALKSDAVWGWKESDAIMARDGTSPGSTKRIFRAIYGAAAFAKEYYPRQGLTTIQTRRMADQMLSRYVELSPAE